jgi:hypothetical protein
VSTGGVERRDGRRRRPRAALWTTAAAPSGGSLSSRPGRRRRRRAGWPERRRCRAAGRPGRRHSSPDQHSSPPRPTSLLSRRCPGTGRRAPDVEWSADAGLGAGWPASDVEQAAAPDVECGAIAGLGARRPAPDMERDEEIGGERARGATMEKPLAPSAVAALSPCPMRPRYHRRTCDLLWTRGPQVGGPKHGRGVDSPRFADVDCSG